MHPFTSAPVHFIRFIRSAGKQVDLFAIENLKMELGGREVLDIPALRIPDHRIVALTGPNGSGKTSLLQLLGGLMPPRRGKILHRGRDLFSQTAAQRDRARRELGIVLQSPYLFKTSVLNNVGYGLRKRGFPPGRSAEMASAALELVGLGGFGKRPHFALSGGEAQRVALARALVLEPHTLLLDEPFANVDTVSRLIIEKVILDQKRSQKTSVIYTTHDLEQAYGLADIVITLFEGKIHDSSMENLFRGSTRQTSTGTVFDTGAVQIAVPSGREEALVAAIPPESILVSLSPASTSARNNFHGRITAVRERNGTVDITVKAGATFIARVTRQSYTEMGLVLGDEVYLIFKAETVKLY